MFAWNDTFYSESTQYFTMLPLQLFAKSRQNAYLKPNLDRRALLKAIARYANENESNEEAVNTWIDNTMKEGRREIYLEEYDSSSMVQDFLGKDEYVCGKLEQYIMNPNNRHFMGNVYNKDFQLVKYSIENGSFGRVITLFLCRLIYCTDEKERTNSVSKQIYPAVVEIFVDKEYIVTSVKTKSNLFLYNPDSTNVTDAETSTCEKQAFSAKQTALRMLQINDVKQNNIERLKTKLFCLVDACTQTPNEIVMLLQENVGKMEQMAKMVTEEICNLAPCYEQDVKWDIQNMIEKYFSMTYPDNRIFTKDRVAYPIKLDATDQQKSKVQQTSGFAQPLQSKDIFFDNKKMLQKNRQCDSAKFSYERLDSLYCPDRFNVLISVNRRNCIIKFTEYTVKEDIDNVLHTIIGT